MPAEQIVSSAGVATRTTRVGSRRRDGAEPSSSTTNSSGAEVQRGGIVERNHITSVRARFPGSPTGPHRLSRLARTPAPGRGPGAASRARRVRRRASSRRGPIRLDLERTRQPSRDGARVEVCIDTARTICEIYWGNNQRKPVEVT
jgi:hypothetical protein